MALRIEDEQHSAGVGGNNSQELKLTREEGLSGERTVDPKLHRQLFMRICPLLMIPIALPLSFLP